jgi:competence CoiA-like predicted nuclease
MSLVALVDGKRKLSYHVERGKFEEIICPHCNSKMLFVDGIKVIKHFRHKIKRNCQYSETERHLEMKDFFVRLLDLTEENVEVRLGENIADIYLPDLNIAIEVQHSPIPYQDILKRTKSYSEKGIHVLWVFDFDLITMKEVSKDITKSEINFKIPIFIKEIHYNMYHHRFYALNDKTLLSIHITPAKSWVEEYYNEYLGYNVGGYWKTLKTEFKILSELIFGLNMISFEKVFSNGLRTVKCGEGKFW